MADRPRRASSQGKGGQARAASPSKKSAGKSSASSTPAKAGANGKGAAAKRASSKKAAAKKATWKKVVGRFFLTVFIVGLVSAIAATIAAVVFYQRTELPNPNKDFTTNTTTVFYRDGVTPIGTFAVQNRTTMPYDSIAPSVKDAVIAAEDRSFWTNKGISPTGIARSVYSIVRGGEIQGGGSTITQQYIKIYYLTSDQTISRKLRELALAVKMGKERSKEDILADYLNTIYFGRGAYGIEAASQAYFNTSSSKLTLEQSAVLASVLNNPAMFDPNEGEANSARLYERYKYVLGGMLAMGTITQAQHDAAVVKLPTFPKIAANSRFGGTKGFLLTMARDELLAQNFTDAQVSGGGLKVITTFDQKLQAQAVTTAQSYTKQVSEDAQPAQDPSKLHVAIASVQVGTGEVLAIYGGADYVANSRNWATTDRAAASTFKAYATVAGLRNGFSLRSRFNGNTFTPPGDGVPVRNEFSHQYGEVTLQRATQDSINTAFVDMTIQIANGPSQVIKAAEDAGVTEGAGWDLNNRISLGTAEVSPVDQAGGYATFANDGKRVTNHVVKEVKSLSGETMYTANFPGVQSIEADIAKDVTYALESVVQQGTGARVSSLGYDIAGKTGTSGIGNEITSAWFVAYTKQISTAVMFVAGDDGAGNLDPYKRPGDATFFGGSYPAMVWADFMKVAMEGQKNIPFADPVYVNSNRTQSPEPPTSPRSSSTPSVSDTPTPTPTTTPSSAQPTVTTRPPTTSAPVTQPPTTSAPTISPPVQTSAPPTVGPTQTGPPATTAPVTQLPTVVPTQQS